MERSEKDHIKRIKHIFYTHSRTTQEAYDLYKYAWDTVNPNNKLQLTHETCFPTK